MRLDVIFTPASLREPEGTVCVVIDALRATSTLVTMFGRGLAEALVAGSLAEARREAAARRGWLLCGEKRSLPPPGFDYGNSPSELDRIDLRGRRAVMTTSNGTRALLRAASCPVVLVGAMLNVSAVAEAVASRSERGVVLLCAGDRYGREFSLEDAFCAGAIAQALRSRAGGRVRLGDGATAALQLYRSYRGSAQAAFRAAEHGRSLARAGFARDVAFCAQRDRFAVVPRLRRARDGTLRLSAGERRR